MPSWVLNEAHHTSLNALLQEDRSVCRRGIMIFPGGMYQFCSDTEAECVAEPYLKAGYHVFVLRYSTGEYNEWPNPMNDYDAAMAIICAHAGEWNLDLEKFAVLGFSSGGHLAACAATIGTFRPRACLLGYAVLSRESIDKRRIGFPAPVDEVRPDTPPCFLFNCADDPRVPVTDPLSFELALAKNNIPFEAHMYQEGGHGFAMADYVKYPHIPKRVAQWIPDSLDWLDSIFK